MRADVTDSGPATAAEAQELTDQIRTSLDDTWKLIERAYQIRAWQALEHPSWDAYCQREFGTKHLRVPREQRREVVESMRGIGMSTRVIAAATGMSKDTVRRALPGGANETPDAKSNVVPIRVTGEDGKSYLAHPARRRRPASEVPDEEIPDIVAPGQMPVCPPQVIREHMKADMAQYEEDGMLLIEDMSPDERVLMDRSLNRLRTALRH
jgi:hypothetical protein